MKTIEETAEYILSIPDEQARKWEIDKLVFVWDTDWGFFETVYYSQGCSDQEVELKKKEYYAGCRNTLMKWFGYVSWL